MHGFRSAWGNTIEAARKRGILKGLISFVGALLKHCVAEEFMLAEEVLGGSLVVLRRPVPLVVLKILGCRIRKFRGVGEHVVAYIRRRILVELIVIAVLIVIAILIAVAIVLVAVAIRVVAVVLVAVRVVARVRIILKVV